MKILGMSIGTIVMVLLIVFIVRKWGASIPLVNRIG